jgi:hypothetical protein
MLNQRGNDFLVDTVNAEMIQRSLSQCGNLESEFSITRIQGVSKYNFALTQCKLIVFPRRLGAS